MTPFWHRLFFRSLAREVTVPISACVHFCGFRYGNRTNPYENYIRSLVEGGSLEQARSEFIEFLRHYRPRHMGEALGLGLRAKYPLWFYPWSRRKCSDGAGWSDDPDACPDILTHFSARGILEKRILAEFEWLEAAWRSIRDRGFRPAEFDSHIEARQLLRREGSSAWLLLDGNHRVAALAALGHTTVPVRYVPLATVALEKLPRWTQVQARRYDPQDAQAVFDIYFDGNASPRTTETAATVLPIRP